MAIRRITTTLVLALILAGCAAPDTRPASDDTLLISVLSTNDVHGELLPKEGRGGLATISGYVDALREAYAKSNDAVLLIDAGDMWQGTLESNLGEGASIVRAYNALGYNAAAIGNHEFDFGPTGPDATPRSDQQDPRSNLKLRATEANFPFLAVNLIDSSTGELVDWENVQPSTMMDIQGIKIGIIGAITERALVTTIAANTRGLQVATLADTIAHEARRLRGDGADIVIVTAHAGSICSEFDDPYDLSSCDMDGEIMRVANALPFGLVDQIIGGHVHEKIAHVVNGIAVTSSKSHTRAFGRVDYSVSRNSGAVLSVKLHPPTVPCPYVEDASRDCAWAPGHGIEVASYAGRPIVVQPEVLAIADQAIAFAKEMKQEKLGVYLESAFTLDGNPESALGNLVTDALLATVDGDIAIHNVSGGIRATLPAGELTFGAVYEMSPFDNRIVVADISGQQLKTVIATQAHNHGRRVGFSGMRTRVVCDNGRMSVDVTLDNGRIIKKDDRVRVIANDYLAYGGDGILEPVIPPGGFPIDESLPMSRDAILQWLRSNGGRLHADDFSTADAPKWNLPADLPPTCTFNPR